MKRNNFVFLVSKYWCWVALLCGPSLAHAAIAPSLGTESAYGVVSSSYTGNIAATNVNGGNVCTTGAFAGFAPVIVGGAVVGPPCPPQTGLDQTAALVTVNGQACTALLSPGALELETASGGPAGHITPGCYTSAAALGITAAGIVTLDGAGTYIFRSTGGAITTGATSSVVLNGADANCVFWAPVGLTTLGGASTFVGNILDAAGITIGLNAVLTGRALTFGNTLTTAAATINVPAASSCGGGGFSIPTLSEWAMIMLAGLLALFGFVAVRRQAK